jgi:hypothetical protein
MLMSRHQNIGQNNNTKTANRSFENVAQLKCLETTVTTRNLIYEEIKSRLNLGNACCHSDLNILLSRLLSKKLKMKIYITTIFPVVLYWCETSSLTSGDV